MLFLGWTLSGCVADESDTALGNDRDGSSLAGNDGASDAENLAGGCVDITQERTYRIADGVVELHPAKGKFRGDILVLPAWGEPRDAWCHRSNFCKIASENGFRVILPEMGKSIYLDTPYPETREDWKETLTYTWLRDSLITSLQDQYCMLDPRGANFVIGLSSGSRGAIKLLSEKNELFMAGVALSGDFDPSQLKGDNIYNGFLGRYEEQSDRWDNSENLTTLVSQIKVPLYLGHGAEDPMVPFTQTRSLYDALVKAQPNLNVKLNIASGLGDGFAYWNTEIDNIFNFLDDTQANRPETP